MRYTDGFGCPILLPDGAHNDDLDGQETAPRDGTQVYLYISALRHSYHLGVVIGMYQGGNWVHPVEQPQGNPARAEPFESPPTHWTHYPPRPPEAPEGELN